MAVTFGNFPHYQRHDSSSLTAPFFSARPSSLFSTLLPHESVRFVGESHPGEDPFEATSRMAGSQSAGPSGNRRRSLRRMAAAFYRLIDEEEEEVSGMRARPLLLERRGERLGIW
ncbi:UNVERIFIED_CONTAM: hypothetical protein Sradi_5628700 [Sesamum radiatum]|uniref:Uncharacterized protein n=1 Tax=Sesamum radiatum TaxID=300843 RepID=A0AAW2L113_SESRA